MRIALQVIIALITIILVATVSKSMAEDLDKPALFTKPLYVPIKPAFVINYGGRGKLKYMKIELTVWVEDTEASNAVRHHLPLIRDYFVSLFSRQTDEDIDTMIGKERLRKTALAGLKTLLLEEDGEEGVIDLFFAHFIVQR
jgi:flagellar FliL protein